jgi:hypothetical protein
MVPSDDFSGEIAPVTNPDRGGKKNMNNVHLPSEKGFNNLRPRTE